MKYILFILGFFCWVDWLPYIDETLLSYFNNLIVFIFCVELFKNFKFLLPLSNLQKILLVYLIYMILCTFLNENLFKLNTMIGILTIVLILIKHVSGTKYVLNGFIFGGLFTSLYMFLMIFDIINVTDYSAVDKFNLGDYFINSKELFISIGFTDKYNKLSYLFSFLVYLIFRFNIKSIFKYALLVLILYLQIKTNGRGGLVISILFVIYLSIRSKIRYIMIPATLLAFLVLINSIFFQGIQSRFNIDNASSLSRLSQYYYAIENFSDNLIFGIGYIPIFDLVNAPYIHNFFLNNLLMGGIIGFTLALSFIVILFRSVMNSKMHKDLKVFLLLLFTLQTMFENFNIIISLGSYLLVWLLIAEYEVNQNITLKGTLIKKNIIK